MDSFGAGGRVLLVGVASPAVIASPLRALGLEAVDATQCYDRATRLLEREPALLVLQVGRRQRSACLGLARAARRAHRTPPVIVSGEGASRALVAEVVCDGLGAYVEDLTHAPELHRCARDLLDPVAMCKRAARSLVGHVELKDALWYLRGLMSREALGRTSGNCRQAADILGVDRRHVARLAYEFQAERFSPLPIALSHPQEECAPFRPRG